MSNESLKLPLSQKVKFEIIDYIHSTGVKKDEALPSENEFSMLLDVSRQTIREAMILLEQDKIITKVQGKGTFLRRIPSTIQSGLEKLESITEMIRKSGLEPSTKWVEISTKPCAEDIAKKLSINTGDDVVYFKRYRSANGMFVAFCIDIIPKEKLKYVPETIQENSIFSYLGKEMAIFLESSTTFINAVLPSDELLSCCDIDKYKPLLELKQIHYNSDDEPVLFSIDYFNLEIMEFKINRMR